MMIVSMNSVKGNAAMSNDTTVLVLNPALRQAKGVSTRANVHDALPNV